jgi:amidophosphoribosyltransferase
MCGVVGVLSKIRPVNQLIFDGLTLLQHRGQDATGIATLDKSELKIRKGNGYVREVYRTRHMNYLSGNIGIGHVRYPTAGCYTKAEAQPLYVNSPYGIALSHNGNLINSVQLATELAAKDKRHINTRSDSEVLLNVFADELYTHGDLSLKPDALFKAIEGVNKRTKGAYATVGLIVGYGIIAFRDPYGLRPLVLGKRQYKGETEWAVASESIALTTQDFEIERDVLPGEAVYIDLQGQLHSKICTEIKCYRPCIFEYVYFSRPDSIVDGLSVHQARKNMGTFLAKKIKREMSLNEIDVIMPIPDTSRTSALEMAKVLDIDFSEGLIKNRYIGRTFIMPGQTTRKKSVKHKLNPVISEFKGKNVMLVDDSIVRGTTSKEIVSLARNAGANKVYIACASPPVLFPYVYGIDMPNQEELIAHQLQTPEKIAQGIGADKIIYQDLPDLIQAVKSSGENPSVTDFDTSCFDGKYTTGDVTKSYLKSIAERSKEA